MLLTSLPGERKMSEEKRMTGYPSIDKPWLKYYTEEAIHAPMPEQTMYQYLWENNRVHLSDIALRFYGTKISYQCLFQNVKKAADAFYAMGLRSGDTVTIMSMHTPETIYAIYGLNYLGAVANMVYMTLSEGEIIRTIENTRSKMFLVLDAVLDRIAKIQDSLLCPVVVLAVLDSMPPLFKLGLRLKAKPQKHSFLTWKAFLANAGESAPMATDHQAPAVIVYTSGTTGEPKGVVLSNDNLNSVVLQCYYSGKYYTRGETGLLILPPFFGFGISMLHLCLRYGINICLWIELDTDKIGKAFQKEKPNRFVGGPAIIDSFLKNVSGDLSYITEFTGGGGSLSPEKERDLNTFLADNHAKVKYTVGYGMTEFSSAVCMQHSQHYREGSLGLPLVQTVVRVVDPQTGKELSYNETGELCFTTPSMMSGYYKAPMETDKIMERTDDGIEWLHTGDLGHVDEDGFVFFEGRIKRIYISTGKDGNSINKIFPQRIEECLESHPAVESCGVAVLPDPVQTNVSIAFVTIKPTVAKRDAVVEELDALSRKDLPEHLRPSVIHILDTMPLTSNGKIDYRALEEMARKM